MADSGRRAACERVKRDFPELAGLAPRTECRGPVRVFTFSKDVPTAPGGPRLRQTVRVTVDAQGRVVKVVASR
jgi:hypothetical protein